MYCRPFLLYGRLSHYMVAVVCFIYTRARLGFSFVFFLLKLSHLDGKKLEGSIKMLLRLTYDSPPFSLPPMFHLSVSPNRRRAAFKTPPFPGRRRSLKNGRRPLHVDRIRPPGARPSPEEGCRVQRPRRAMKSASGRRRWSGETEESATPRRSPVEPVVEGFDGDGEDYEP